MPTPVIITVAITGALPRKKDNPAVPMTPAEQIESTHEAFEAGASLVHIHVRNEDESPSSDRALYGAVQEGVRKHCPGMIVQFSTGGRDRDQLHIIAIIPSYSFRNVDNSKRELKVPADMKGLKFRVTKSPAEFNMIKAWGGTAVPYDWGQLYDGLQSGVVDGMYIPDAYVAAMRFYEVTKYITQTGGSWNAHIFFMDQKRYERLPDWAKAAVDRIGKEIRQQSFKVDNEWMAKQTEALKGKVKMYKPTAAELQLWYEGAPAAWVAVKGTYDPALAKRALQDQGQDALIKKLQAAGAL